MASSARIALGVVAFVGLLLALPRLACPEDRIVIRVIDGDTLVLDGGERVRLIGLDTPETVHPKKPVERFGKEASAFPNARLFTISQYLGSSAAVIDGRSVTRQDVIKYFANVRGGVHLGRHQQRAEKKLVARIEKLEGRVKLVHTDGLLTELLAIGQAIGASADAKTLIERIQGKSVRESEGKPRPSPS